MELKNRHGPSHWKFDSNLTKDKEYIKIMRTVSEFGLRSFKDANDKRVLWDSIKYRIGRLYEIRQGKSTAKKTKHT